MKHLIVLFSLVSTMVWAQSEKTLPTVTVSGEGTVMVVPDRVSISVEVFTEGEQVKAVKSHNDQAVTNVVRFLEQSGLDKKNYKTQYVNLQKTYDYNTKTYQYRVSQSISILLDKIDLYDFIMQGLLEAGVNQINGVSFEVSNREKYLSEARKKAMLNAQKKAKEYAQALGQNIGKAVQIKDTYEPVPYPRMAKLSAMETSADTSTLMTGSMEITSEVNVVFELK